MFLSLSISDWENSGWNHKELTPAFLMYRKISTSTYTFNTLVFLTLGFNKLTEGSSERLEVDSPSGLFFPFFCFFGQRFVRGADGGMDATAHVEIALNFHPPGTAGSNQVVENIVDHFFVERPLTPVRP